MDALIDKVGEQWALKDILTPESICEIISDIENGTTVAVSDGSFKGMGGTTTWIVEKKKGRNGLWVMLMFRVLF